MTERLNRSDDDELEPEAPAPEDGAPDAEPSFGARSNRRARTSGSLRMCRMCWKPITIEARYIEEDPPHIYFRCPNCSHSFPIRSSDIPAADGTFSKADRPEKTRPSPSDPPSGEIWSALEKNVIDKLDLDAVRAFLAQLDAIHLSHGASAESRALYNTLYERERLLIALEDLGKSLEAFENDAATYPQ